MTGSVIVTVELKVAISVTCSRGRLARELF
jgi:hypothetical protein